MTSKYPSVYDYVGDPTDDLIKEDNAAKNSGDGIDFEQILKGGIQGGLDALTAGLSGQGGDKTGPFSRVLAAGPALYFDN